MKLALLALLLAGCGQQVVYTDAAPNDWDADLKPYALAYAQDAADFGLPPGKLGMVGVIRTDDARVEELIPSAENETIGVCKEWGHGRHYRGEIYIKAVDDEDLRRRLMYHELTHCVYEQEHFGEDGDIMNAILDTTVFDWETARQRLFEMLRQRLCSQQACP